MIQSSGKSLKHLFSIVCLVGIYVTTLAAQQRDLASHPVSQPIPKPPIAFVYVSKTPINPGPNQVLGFGAAANGSLTPIEGSPFQADVQLMAVNGKFLFGSTTDQLYFNSYSIGKNGALTFSVANDIGHITGGADTTGFTGNLALDHTGATLYALRLMDNDVYEAFVIDKATGALTLPSGFTMGAGDNMDSPGAFTFSANDKYMYGVDSGWAAYQTVMYVRASNGALVPTPAGTTGVSNPVDKDGFRFNPVGISADPLNHVAVAFANEEGNTGPRSGPEQLGVYTAAANGSLTTTSNYKNMPKVAVGDVSLRMAPSGKLLAAFGDAGLQVFHFNEGQPITAYATLVQNVAFGEGYWDNDNHLFAISGAGKLYVFTVTPTSITQAPGSPHSIPGAQSLIVRPLL